VGNYVTTFCRRGPHQLFRSCKQKGYLIFCMCVMVVLIFILSALSCAPLHACLYFVFAFGCFHRVHLCSPPSSGFSARLRALVDPFTAGCPRVGFHWLVGVRSALEWGFILCSWSRYLFVPYPSDYMPVCWLFCLSHR
jgi:hypothetical protein